MAYDDAFPVVSNFFETALSSQVISSDTTLYLSNVTALPKIIAGRDFIPMVLTNGVDREIVYIKKVDTANSCVSVTRGHEGTTAREWPDLTYAYATMTAGGLQRLRINGFCPLLNANGNRPSLTKTSNNSFSLAGDWTDRLEPNVAVRLLSASGVVPLTDAKKQAIHITQVECVNNVTTVSVRNAVVPSNINGIDIGIEPSAAPLYTPNSVIGDGTSIVQTGNTLSVPSASDNTRGLVNTNDIIRLAQAAILKAAYPVGAVYISTVATSPASLFGGTWQSLGGRFLVGANSTYGAGSTGGEATHKITQDELPDVKISGTTNEEPDHTHGRGNMNITGTFNAVTGGWSGSGAFYGTAARQNRISAGTVEDGVAGTGFDASKSWSGTTSANGKHTHKITTNALGSGKAHNNLPPYLAVYMWKRTA